MTENHPSDLTSLRERWPAWQIDAQWTTAATGPDARLLMAQRGTTTLTAWTATQLAEQISQAEANQTGR